MGDESMRSNTSMMSKMADIEGTGNLVFSNWMFTLLIFSNSLWIHFERPSQARRATRDRQARQSRSQRYGFGIVEFKYVQRSPVIF